MIDFKTDEPAGTDIAKTYPEYVAQVRTYAAIVRANRAGLLFTASGHIAWLDVT